MGIIYDMVLIKCFEKVWYDFDDSSVTKINKENLRNLAFGGEYTHSVWDANLKKRVNRKSTRTNNAYCLVYERVPSSSAPSSSPESIEMAS